MTALDNVAIIRCDGPAPDRDCPDRAARTSTAILARELRVILRRDGWSSTSLGDAPDLDHCPACGPGAP